LDKLIDQMSGVAYHPANTTLVDKVAENPIGPATNITMPSVGHRHRDNPAPDQFLGIAWIRPLAKLLGRHQFKQFGGCH
jgi:hypothetical protein